MIWIATRSTAGCSNIVGIVMNVKCVNCKTVVVNIYFARVYCPNAVAKTYVRLVQVNLCENIIAVASGKICGRIYGTTFIFPIIPDNAALQRIVVNGLLYSYVAKRIEQRYSQLLAIYG